MSPWRDLCPSLQGRKFSPSREAAVTALFLQEKIGTMAWPQAAPTPLAGEGDMSVVQCNTRAPRTALRKLGGVSILFACYGQVTRKAFDAGCLWTRDARAHCFTADMKIPDGVSVGAAAFVAVSSPPLNLLWLFPCLRRAPQLPRAVPARHSAAGWQRDVAAGPGSPRRGRRIFPGAALVPAVPTRADSPHKLSSSLCFPTQTPRRNFSGWFKMKSRTRDQEAGAIRAAARRFSCLLLPGMYGKSD